MLLIMMGVYLAESVRLEDLGGQFWFCQEKLLSWIAGIVFLGIQIWFKDDEHMCSFYRKLWRIMSPSFRPLLPLRPRPSTRSLTVFLVAVQLRSINIAPRLHGAVELLLNGDQHKPCACFNQKACKNTTSVAEGKPKTPQKIASKCAKIF